MCAVEVAVVIVVILLLVFLWRVSHKKGTREGFSVLAEFPYHPCMFYPHDDARRATCMGYTSGAMPSIDTELEGDFLSCGAIGVPP